MKITACGCLMNCLEEKRFHLKQDNANLSFAPYLMKGDYTNVCRNAMYCN